MKREMNTTILIWLVVGSCLMGAAWAESPPKLQKQPVGALAGESQSVLINGVAAERGTTVFSGSEIRTGATAAAVHLTGGGGLVSIAPESHVKLVREKDTIIAEVSKGSVTMRSPLASVVVAPDQTVRSGPNNLYTVSTSSAGSVVESFLKEVAVRAADGVVRTVAPKAPVTGGRTTTPLQAGVGEPEPITPVRGPFVVANCTLTGNTLIVSGAVACNGIAVAGASVTVHVTTKGLPPVTLRQTVTADEAGRFRTTFTNDALSRGGTARISAVTNIPACGTAAGSCQF
ncbi:MAG: hypothetical protein RMM98_06890 [Acidobacteriota bacterium]|nr:hypothetical protein [Acidobacteriota bacterium]